MTKLSPKIYPPLLNAQWTKLSEGMLTDEDTHFLLKQALMLPGCQGTHLVNIYTLEGKKPDKAPLPDPISLLDRTTAFSQGSPAASAPASVDSSEKWK